MISLHLLTTNARYDDKMDRGTCIYSLHLVMDKRHLSYGSHYLSQTVNYLFNAPRFTSKPIPARRKS